MKTSFSLNETIQFYSKSSPSLLQGVIIEKRENHFIVLRKKVRYLVKSEQIKKLHGRKALIDYKKDETLNPFKININNKKFLVSIHAQERLIERKIVSKIKIKNFMNNIDQNLIEIKKTTTKKSRIRELLKHNEVSRVYINKSKNIALVTVDNIITTVYPFKGSKYDI